MTFEDGNRLPRPCAINYSRICRSARAETVPALIGFLRQHLPVKWIEVYSATASHVVSVVKLKRETFEYYFDLYSGLEALGEVTFDQRIRDRVIGVLGTSAPRRAPRHGSLQNGCLDLPEELVHSPRDKGYFIAHSIGGGLDVNVFLQDRRLNRGLSGAGNFIGRWRTTALLIRGRSVSPGLCMPTRQVFHVGWSLG